MRIEEMIQMIAPYRNLGRTAVTLCLAAVGVAAGPGIASAAAPETFTQDVSDSYTDDFLSEACGTTVVVSQSGTVVVTIWRNDAGLVVREQDRFSGAKLTFSAPEANQSFSVRLQSDTTWDYGAGATLGSEVVITARGLLAHVPGQTSAFAGKQAYRATVDRFDENGVPINEDGADFLNFVGHQPDVDFGAAICEALAG